MCASWWKGGLVLMFRTLAKGRRQGWSIDIEEAPAGLIRC